MPGVAFTPDSPLVTRVRPGLAYSRGLLLPREWPAVATVPHTTGAGIPARFKREGARKGDEDALDTALRVYATIMKPSPHYVVDQLGQVGQCVPERLIAWHVGAGRDADPYRRGEVDKIPAWWRERWPDLETPCDLAGGELYRPYLGATTKKRVPRSWREGAVNPNTLGIEVVPPLDDPRGEWTPECWASLARLSRCISGRHGHPLTREHVPTHSDCHPIDRTARGEPWDPGPAQWSWERMEQALAA